MNLSGIFVSLFCLLLLVAYITVQFYLPVQNEYLKTWNLTKTKKRDSKRYMISKELRYIYVGNTMEAVLPEWGGNCTRRNWEKCRLQPEVWNVSYPIKRKNPKLGYKYFKINCTIPSEVLCLRNGWTVTRCQLLCMRCNREMQTKYEKYVSKEGPCEMDEFSAKSLANE